MRTSTHVFGRIAPRRTRRLRLVMAALRTIHVAARRILKEWQRRRLAYATHVALRSLDARTLRDLGIDHSELTSVAAEMAGIAEPTRARVVQSLRNLD